MTDKSIHGIDKAASKMEVVFELPGGYILQRRHILTIWLVSDMGCKEEVQNSVKFIQRNLT